MDRRYQAPPSSTTGNITGRAHHSAPRRSHAGPYDRPPPSSRPHQHQHHQHQHHHPRSPRTMEEALRSDTLIYPDQLNQIGDLGELDYAGYRSKHRQAILERFFVAHKDEAWFREWYGGEQQKSMPFAPLNEENELKLEDGEDLAMAPMEDPALRLVPAAMLPARLQGAFTPRQLSRSLAISNIPPTLSRRRLEEGISGALERPQEFSLWLSHPIPDKAFYRTGWLVFPDEAAEIDLTQLALRLEEHAFEEPGAPSAARLFFSPTRTYSLQIRLADAVFSQPERRAKDRELAAQLLTALGSEAAETASLDQLLVQLRRAHHVCFYCGIQCANHYELWRYCGDLHVRSNVARDANAGEWLDNRIADLMAMQSPQLAEPSEERLLDRHVIRVDEGRYRCQACGKLFKGPEFVIKHLQGKHEDLVQESLGDLPLLRSLFAHPVPPAWPLTPWRLAKDEQPRASEYRRRGSRDEGYPGPPSSTSRPLPPSTDPHGRPIRRYQDWDRPPSGEVEISYD